MGETGPPCPSTRGSTQTESPNGPGKTGTYPEEGAGTRPTQAGKGEALHSGLVEEANKPRYQLMGELRRGEGNNNPDCSSLSSGMALFRDIHDSE